MRSLLNFGESFFRSIFFCGNNHLILCNCLLFWNTGDAGNTDGHVGGTVSSRSMEGNGVHDCHVYSDFSVIDRFRPPFPRRIGQIYCRDDCPPFLRVQVHFPRLRSIR
jgi:hypothetical protein